MKATGGEALERVEVNAVTDDGHVLVTRGDELWDGADADQKWLTVLTREHDLNAAIYLDVITPGSIAVGDEVQLHTAE
nr:hypothetical protein [Pseudoclavibacter sp. Marseille-Q3772]